MTERHYENHFDGLALTLARRSNELTEYGNRSFIETLAMAELQNGDLARAAALEEKAFEEQGADVGQEDG